MILLIINGINSPKGKYFSLNDNSCNAASVLFQIQIPAAADLALSDTSMRISSSGRSTRQDDSLGTYRTYSLRAAMPPVSRTLARAAEFQSAAQTWHRAVVEIAGVQREIALQIGRRRASTSKAVSRIVGGLVCPLSDGGSSGPDVQLTCTT